MIVSLANTFCAFFLLKYSYNNVLRSLRILPRHIVLLVSLFLPFHRMLYFKHRKILFMYIVDKIPLKFVFN